MPVLRNLGLVVCSALLLRAATARYELSGQIEELDRAVHVGLYDAESPFNASTTSNAHGQFHFRNLRPGSYSVSIFLRGRGEVRRTVVISPAFADEKAVVYLSIPLPPPTTTTNPDRARRRNTVSLTQLSIPDSAREAYAAAQRDLAKRLTEHAITHLKQAVALAPKFAEAWNSLGVIAYQTKDYPLAEQYFRTALATDSNGWTPTVNLGGVLLNLNRPEEALPYNLRAVERRPNDALANSQLGITYYHLQQWDTAEQYLSTAERLDPSHFSHPQLMLAQIYARRGDKEATVRELHNYLSRFPDGPVSDQIRVNLQAFEH